MRRWANPAISIDSPEWRSAVGYILHHEQVGDGAIFYIPNVYSYRYYAHRALEAGGKPAPEVLYPPPPQQGYFTDQYGDFIFSPSRLTPLKRVPLLIEALSKTKEGRVVIAGDGPEKQKIIDLIKSNSLENRVQMVGHVDDETMLGLYARCRAVYYAPVNEDFGLVTLEAFRSRKPVITAVDSGGPTELVIHGSNGFIASPDAADMALRITTLLENTPLAEQMGNSGYEDCRAINWPTTVSRLLE